MARLSLQPLLGTPVLFRPGFRGADPLKGLGKPNWEGLGRRAGMTFQSPPQAPGPFVHLSSPCSVGHVWERDVKRVVPRGSKTK